jgi:hypothetical protein
MMNKYAVFLACACLLGGCATQRSGLYRWDGYDQALYDAYKDPDKTGELVLNLENLTSGLAKAQLKMPPGLYAELGTLYLQMGEQDKAIALYEKERDSWPESKTLMEALIKNLRRLKPVSGQPSASDPGPAPIPPPPSVSSPAPKGEKK